MVHIEKYEPFFFIFIIFFNIIKLVNFMNELFLERMKGYLGNDLYNEYLKCLEESPYRSIRLNNIDFNTFVNNTKMPLEKIPYDMDGYYLLDDLKYGTSIYHHAGGFYFQEPSAMLPVNIFNFKGNENVLDLCASPGGKSSQILRRIPNGVLVSNEIDKKRSDILFSNLERLGFKNAIITNNDSHKLASVFKGFFDVILIDAPCSGEGMMRKEIEAREGWSLDNIKLCHNRDIEIIDEANKMLKKGGHLIYSTCTFAREEDEDIVEYIKSLGYHTIEASQAIKDATYPGFIKDTYRFYPMKKGEGQFVALLEKDSDGESIKLKKLSNNKDKDLNVVLKFIKDNLDLDIDSKSIVKYGNRYYLQALNYDLSKLNIKNYGVELGEVLNNRFIPYHHMFKALFKYFKNKVVLDYNDQRINHYLKGEEIVVENTNNGFGVLICDNLPIGGFKATNNHLKNHYPKGLRNMNL